MCHSELYAKSSDKVHRSGMVESLSHSRQASCLTPREFCDLPSTANLMQNSKPFRLNHTTAYSNSSLFLQMDSALPVTLNLF